MVTDEKKPAVLAIAYWAIEKLIPYVRNARTHSPEQVAQVAASIREFGWTNPILVDGEGSIIAGHARLLAARKLGMKEVPVIVLGHLSDTQRRALVLADNKLALNAGWDEDMLKLEIEALDGLDFDLELTGFSDEEIAQFLHAGTEGLTDEDAVPEAPVEPVSVLGDMWLLGGHRVLCGDSTSVDAVARLMDGQKADMVFTDPPYGVNFGEANHNPHAKRWAKIKNDDKAGAELNDFLHECFANIILHAVEACPVYVWSASMAAGYEMLLALQRADFHIQSQIIWFKNCIVLGQADYQWRHEQCWYGWTPGKNHYWAGGRDKSTVWEVSKDANQSYQHPAQKPVALSERAISNSCREDGKVLDLFGGSGSTLIGCEKAGRNARLMEITPTYVDCIVARWQNFTGKQATLEGDGRTFGEISKQRLGAKVEVA